VPEHGLAPIVAARHLASVTSFGSCLPWENRKRREEPKVPPPPEAVQVQDCSLPRTVSYTYMLIVRQVTAKVRDIFERGYETNIFKMQIGGGEPVQFTFFEHAKTASPGWSPDGQRFAFIGDQKGTPRVPGTPVFSPDGKKMAVYWNRKDEGLWIISPEPYSQTRLLPGDTVPLGWSPDGKHVYAIGLAYLSGREIVRVQVASPNEVTSVATLPDFIEYAWASVSPDGQEIFASVGEKKSDVWLMENFDPSLR
jgi:Tol biopolymer transport system component